MIDYGAFADSQTTLIIDVMQRVQDARGRWVERPIQRRLDGYFIQDQPPGALATFTTAGLSTGSQYVGLLIGPTHPLLKTGVMFTDEADGERYQIEDMEVWGEQDLIACSLSTPQAARTPEP